MSGGIAGTVGTYLTSTFFMLVTMGILIFRAFASIKRKQSKRRCLILLFTIAMYVLFDALFIAVDMNPQKYSSFVFRAVAFVFYIVYCLVPYAWHLFVRNFVGNTYKKITFYIEWIPGILLLLLVLTNPFTHWLWSFEWKYSGSMGLVKYTYVRGNLFDFYSILNFFYYVEPVIDCIVAVIRKRFKEERYLIPAMLFSSIPLVSALVNAFVLPQYLIYPFNPFCMVSVALLSFFFMASTEASAIRDKQEKIVADALAGAQISEKKAIEANKVKTTFLSNVSHDIRTPMNAIINLTELARQETDINVIQGYLEKMSISGNFLLGLINDVLDMSKIESGELEFHRENLTRTEFLNTVDTVIMPLVKKKNIHFHPELNPGEYTISVDKLRFNQIFFNLLTNAVKFTPDGGDVWFEVHNMETKDNKLTIKFVVRDNGVGMTEEFQRHMFEPFAREHSGTGERIRGTGLGLSIVKSLIDAIGGTITCKSELGKGTEFTVMFDVDIVDRAELAPSERVFTEDKSMLNGMKILLVEDNEINTYVAKIILEKAGCVVSTAVNGAEAVDFVKNSEQGSIDAILMDVRMPVMDGIEATKRIRALEREDAKTVPIIAMTADAFDEEKKKTLESGMNYHLSKPVDAEKLCAVLTECMKNKKQ